MSYVNVNANHVFQQIPVVQSVALTLLKLLFEQIALIRKTAVVSSEKEE